MATSRSHYYKTAAWLVALLSRPRSIRALGASFVLIATLLWTVNAAAFSGSVPIKYGTVSYSISNLDGGYKPGEEYTLDVSFHFNDQVPGKNLTKIISVGVDLGDDRAPSTTAIMKKNRTCSSSLSFTAPNNGKKLIIRIIDPFEPGVKEVASIPPLEPGAEAEPDEEEDTSTPGDDDDSDEEYDDPSDTEADENADDEDWSLPDIDFGSMSHEIEHIIDEWFSGDPLGLDRAATPGEALGIGAIGALISLLLGGGVGGAFGGGVGGAGGAAGGSFPPPIEGGAGGPPPLENPYQGIEDKYVTRDPDGSITIRDPITGEQKLYLPDGHGGYDNPLGGGFQSEQDMLEHLSYLDRNRYPLSQDAATAARNQAAQHQQWEEHSLRDAERGYSDESADYKKWREEEERKTEQIIKLADKYFSAADESAKQESIAADNNVVVVGLESTKNVASTSLVLIPMALSGVGTVSAATMANAKLVQSGFSFADSVITKVGDAYVEGKSIGKATAHGVTEGLVKVAQNYAGEIGGAAAGKLAGASSELVKKGVELGTEATVVIGGRGVTDGLDEYAKSGDLSKALDKAKAGMAEEAQKHLVNKAVESTRMKADTAAKTVTTRQQAVTRTQQQVSSAKQRVTNAQQSAQRSQQKLTRAQSKASSASKNLTNANKRVDAAQKQLSQAKTPEAKSRAEAQLANAQKNAAKAQQKYEKASSELRTADRVNTATQRAAVNAEHDLQKATTRKWPT